MSRILRRPMFKMGGSTNSGIMHGLVDRKRYSDAGIVERAGELIPGFEELLTEYTPKTKLPIGMLGANLVAGMPFSKAVQDPYKSFVSADDARRAGIKTGAAKIGIQQALSEAQPGKNILMNRKKAIVNLQSKGIELTPENIVKETARLNKLDEYGKAVSPDRIFESALAANEQTYGSEGPEAYNATVWSKRISPMLRQENKNIGGKIKKNKDGSYKKPKTADAYYIDLDLGEVIYFDGTNLKPVTDQYAELFQ